MNRQWVEHLERDTGARGFILMLSMVASSISGLVANVAGFSIESAQVLALGVGAFVFLILASFYSSERKDKVRRFSKVLLKNSYFPFIVISSAALIALAVSIVSPGVQAAILNGRLNAALNDQPIKRNFETNNVLRNARESKVKLQPDLVSSVMTYTEQGNNAADWSSYVAAVNYDFNMRPFNSGSWNYQNNLFDLGHNNTFTDVKFTGFRIIYHGGPLKLTRVTFRDTVFDIDDTDNGKALAEALRASKDGSVTISLP